MEPEPTCCHKFVLGDSRTGPVAVGTCIYCGEKRAFANTIGGALDKGLPRSTFLASLINQGRALREVPLKGPTLAQEAESFKVRR